MEWRDLAPQIRDDRASHREPKRGYSSCQMLHQPWKSHLCLEYLDSGLFPPQQIVSPWFIMTLRSSVTAQWTIPWCLSTRAEYESIHASIHVASITFGHSHHLFGKTLTSFLSMTFIRLLTLQLPKKWEKKSYLQFPIWFCSCRLLDNTCNQGLPEESLHNGGYLSAANVKVVHLEIRKTIESGSSVYMQSLHFPCGGTDGGQDSCLPVEPWQTLEDKQRSMRRCSEEASLSLETSGSRAEGGRNMNDAHLRIIPWRAHPALKRHSWLFNR